jgi:hypothetical protein
VKKVALIFIGTYKYADFFPKWKEHVDRFFLTKCEKTIFVFTDRSDEDFFNLPDVVVNEVEHLSWPFITLFRFKMMKAISNDLSRFDYVFFLDADLFPTTEIKISEISSQDKSLVGVQHPGNYKILYEKKNNIQKNYEWDPTCKTKGSLAFIKGKISDYGTEFYHQGCFWGGESKAIINLVSTLNRNVDKDLENNVIADWHDESHLNMFFLENQNLLLTIHPGYAMPELVEDHEKKYYKCLDSLPKKMIHLQKDSQYFPRFKGASPE